MLCAPSQNLVEYIVRCKIYDCQYWKEHCFGLTAESLIDKAVDLRSCGGTFGGARKPCEFMCLTLKLLQLQPEKDIIIEYIKNDDFKYVRILGAGQRPPRPSGLHLSTPLFCSCARAEHSHSHNCRSALAAVVCRGGACWIPGSDVMQCLHQVDRCCGAAGAYYLRLVGKPLEVYRYLEPLLIDNRKVSRALPFASFGSNSGPAPIWKPGGSPHGAPHAAIEQAAAG